MKSRNPKCLLKPSGANRECPLESTVTATADRRSAPPSVVVVRSDRRSWITIAITAFGAVLLRYLRIMRERRNTLRKR